MLKNAAILAIVAVDTAENEPSKNTHEGVAGLAETPAANARACGEKGVGPINVLL